MSRPSLRAAIDAKCKGCIYDPGSGEGAWREQVAGCSSSNCPLHAVRPLPVKASKPAVEAEEAAALDLGSAEHERTLPGPKIGLNNRVASERRAA